MGRLVLGVDPGFSGALALYNIDSQKLETVIDMPLVASPKKSGTRQIDPYAMGLWLEAYSADIVLAVIEAVGSRPGEGVSSVFKFGYGAGIIAGVVAASLIPMHLTPPATWKLLMNLSSDKRLSCTKAAKLFPNFEKQFSRVKDNGRAEAALLAKFGERLVPLVQKRRGAQLL